MITLDQAKKLSAKTKLEDQRGNVYDFGYISRTKAMIVFDEGECNMQDASAFELISNGSDPAFYKLKILK